MSAIQPIEDFVFEGLGNRIQQVFGCRCIYTTANDKTQVLARLSEGKKVEYPYIFMTLQNMGPNTESYATNRIARRGLAVTVGDNQAQTVRLLPTNFELEIEFITNKFKGFEQGSVLAFARRWLFARRCGYLKFNIKYGRLALWVSATLGEQVTVPQLENKVETETSYKVTTTITVHGYSSEPELGTQGIVQDLVVDGVVLNADGSLPGSQFFSFNRGASL